MKAVATKPLEEPSFCTCKWGVAASRPLCPRNSTMEICTVCRIGAVLNPTTMVCEENRSCKCLQVFKDSKYHQYTPPPPPLPPILCGSPAEDYLNKDVEKMLGGPARHNETRIQEVGFGELEPDCDDPVKFIANEPVGTGYWYRAAGTGECRTINKTKFAGVKKLQQELVTKRCIQCMGATGQVWATAGHFPARGVSVNMHVVGHLVEWTDPTQFVKDGPNAGDQLREEGIIFMTTNHLKSYGLARGKAIAVLVKGLDTFENAPALTVRSLFNRDVEAATDEASEGTTYFGMGDGWLRAHLL